MAGTPWLQAVAGMGSIADNLVAQQMHVGLMLFPGIGEELSCQPGRVYVEPRLAAGPAIRDTLTRPDASAVKDRGYTPTRSTLAAAHDWLVARRGSTTVDAQYIILITDGGPNCQNTATKWASDTEATLTELDSIANDEISTYVVGYRAPDIGDTLDEMARRGGTETHIPVADSQSLATTIESLQRQVVSCRYELDEIAVDPLYLRVRLDGQELEEDQDGYTVQGNIVEFKGKSCERLRDGQRHKVAVDRVCEPKAVL
jgi:hypothetical protein